MRRALGRLADALLWVTTVLGAAALLATAALWLTDTRPLVVRSDSMAPTYDARSVVLVHRVDADDIRAGDVVTVTLPGGQRVLHRVIDVDATPAGPSVRTKGDANRTADAERIVLPAGEPAWRAGASVPAVGGVATLLRTPAAGFLLAVALLGPLAVARRAPGRPGAAAEPLTA
jgi:signal peptidase I